MKFPKILLGSGSPRRVELLELAGFDFRQISPEVEEVWPEEMPVEEIPEHLADLKANALLKKRKAGEVIITADSIVVHRGKLLGKPANLEEAAEFLKLLSASQHHVITGVCMVSDKGKWHQSEVAEVSMDELSEEEIEFYIKNYQPLDKAGAYGIQEWIGLCRVSRINGTFSNIMGLPMHLVYQMLKKV